MNIQDIKQKRWIPQACEGTLWLFYPPAIANIETIWDRFSMGYDNLVGYLKNNYCYWIYDAEYVEKLAKHILQREKREPGLTKSLIQEWKKDEKLFYEACKHVDQTDVSVLSDIELVSAFKKLYRSYLNQWGLSIMADSISLYGEHFVRDLLIPHLEKRGEREKFSTYLPILTAPVERSFATEEAEDFIFLLKEVKESKTLQENFKKEDLKQSLQNHPQFLSKLKEHAKKYFWIQNSYLHGKFLTAYDFAKLLKDRLLEQIHFDAEITRLHTTAEKAKKEKNVLIKKLDLPKDLLLILNLIELFATWQDQRKKNCLIGNSYMIFFLEELAKRRKCKKEELYGLKADEYESALHGKVDLKEIIQRQKESFFICTKKDKIQIILGSEAKKYYEATLESHEEIGDIRGICASQGRAEGKVRVILNTADLSKMQKGDILVSSMTRPELVPAMNKAAAIVTDEGGITSHAAIVSRELGIPCVIGTKIATKVLKDDDFVEVNANHGTVRKIDLEKEYKND